MFYPEFERTTSPGDKINFRILSTKHTTEEAEDFSCKGQNDLFSKTLNKGFLKDLSVSENKPCNQSIAYTISKPVPNVEKEDSFQSIVNIGVPSINKSLSDKNGSHFDSQKDGAPSVKDIKGGNSCSTIERDFPQELMEDSLNTCSMNKGSTAKKATKAPAKTSDMEKGNFINTLANAINYFTTPQLKMSKSKNRKPMTTVHSSVVSPKSKEKVSKNLQIFKKNSKFTNKKLIATKSAVNKSMVENSSSFTEFRSPKRVQRTNLNKFNANKVLKTEQDALPDDQTFYLMSKLTFHSNALDEVKDSMEEDIIEDSLNKDSEDNRLQSRVQQLECEVLRLQRIIQDERSKNKELELTINYFQQLYHKEKNDKTEAQSAFHQVLGSMYVADQPSLVHNRKSEEVSFIIMVFK